MVSVMAMFGDALSLLARTMRWRLIAVAVTLGVVLATAVASSAHATIFDSAHEPEPIGDAGVTTATAPLGGRFDNFDVSLSFGLTCPAGEPVPYKMTFADPTGSASIPLLDPCAGTWQNPPPNFTTDFLVSSSNGIADIPAIGFVGNSPKASFDALATTPFLYQVTGPAGTIAQGAMTATYTPPEEIDQQHEIDNFINVCLNGNHELHSKNGGDLYCEIGGGTVYTPGGWPAPPQAPPVQVRPSLRDCERPWPNGASLDATANVSCRTARTVRARLFGRAYFSTRPTRCENRTYCVVMGFRCYGRWEGRLRPFSYAHHASCRSGRRRIVVDIG